MKLVNQRPKVKIRTNGVSVGYTNKGHFVLESWGKCRLLLNSNKPPFLIITKNNGGKIIVNYKEQTETEDTYRQIKLLKENINDNIVNKN